jgi:hypothetical protein
VIPDDLLHQRSEPAPAADRSEKIREMAPELFEFVGKVAEQAKKSPAPPRLKR